MHPILAALKHHKTAVILVALEIALTCAIVSNAIFIIGDRLGAMHIDSGVADKQLIWASSSGLDTEAAQANQASMGAADMAALRAMPGVTNVVKTNSLPLTRRSFSSGVSRAPGNDRSTLNNVVFYAGTQGVVQTLGITLSEGRDFLPQEYTDYSPIDPKKNVPSPAVIVTRTLAQALWPGQDPLGKPIFLGDKGKNVTHVVGVTDHLLNPNINKYSGTELNLLFPVTAVAGGMYVLRVTPDARDATLRNLPKVLDSVNDQRIITDRHVLSDTINDYFHDDRALIWLLLVVIGCLLALTALGVVGLSSFWVQQRTRQIGIRRAIGATRGDIVRYFLAENVMIVGAGIVVGSIAAVGLNLWLMKQYELPHMPLWVLLIGAPMLWLLGVLSALGPALRAAAVSPVVATRSV